MASNLVKSLRLTENPLEGDPIREECCRRVVCTVVLMDRTLSSSLNLPCCFSLHQCFKEPCTEQELKSMGSARKNVMDHLELETPNLIAAIFRLSHLFCEVCIYHRHGGYEDDLQNFEQRHSEWINTLHDSLVYSQVNFEMHQMRGTLRQFLYLHLLYHHIGQLLLFPSLRASDSRSSDTADCPSRIMQCHYHARRITEIVEHGWRIAGMDIHNVSFGQILTVAAAVHMHSCLTARSKGQREARQANLTVINDCFSRVRKHCRIFDRIVSFWPFI